MNLLNVLERVGRKAGAVLSGDLSEVSLRRKNDSEKIRYLHLRLFQCSYKIFIIYNLIILHQRLSNPDKTYCVRRVPSRKNLK